PGAGPALRRWNPALLAYGIVGFTALAYEVAWTRALSMVLGSSIYAFAILLATFLGGIALGSLAARRWVDRLARPLAVYAGGIGVLGLLSLLTLATFRWLPDLFVALVSRLGTSQGAIAGTGLVVAAAAMLAPTLVLGALFPLVTRSIASADRPASATVGDVYFVNTLGSAGGAFFAGFVLIPGLGLRTTLAAIMAVDMAACAALLLWQRQWTGGGRAAATVLAAAVAVLVLAFPPSWNVDGLTRGVYRAHFAGLDSGIELEPLEGVDAEQVLYYQDGINATVSVHRERGHTLLRINGKVDAGTGSDMGTQILLGQVPMMFGERPDRVLVIGLASGVTVGSVALHEPSVIDVVELEPAMTEACRFFDEVNFQCLDRAGVTVIADDGRNFLSCTREQYDVIISEPSNPWITGAASLFTREFFEAARTALAPDGRLVQWVQLYEADPASVLSILASLRSVFPYVHGFLQHQVSADLILLAGDRPLGAEDFPHWEQLPESVRGDLRRLDVHSTADLWTLLRITPLDIDALVREAPVLNSDDNMYVELRVPRTIYSDWLDVENARMLLRPTNGVWPLLAKSGPLAPDTVADLAVSYAGTRDDARIAGVMLERLARDAPQAARRAQLEVGLVLAEYTSLDQALAWADEALALDPDSHALHRLRSDALFRLGRHDEALRAVQSSLEIEPLDSRSRGLQMRVLAALGRPQAALAEASALIDSSHELVDRELWYEAGRIALASGHLDRALEFVERHVERYPHGSLGWTLLGRIQRARGDAAEAERAVQNSGRARQNNVRLLHLRARELERLSVDQAVAALTEIVQAHPTYTPAREDLIRLDGRPEAARTETPAARARD
ncbi:MAG: tetratricopeptide repeat protein, partial [bacterium]|nr:tetratricopeptide repeat protein [bacterium]